jgi:hypothetical protein
VNNNNANISGDELDEELGDFQLPLSLTPRASSTLSHTNVIQQQRSSSASATIPFSLQHNVVLHSNINDPLLPATNRFDLNLPLDTESRNQLNRKANSLMTVYEQGATNETMIRESSSKSETWRGNSPSSVSDLTYQRTATVPITEKPTDEQETVRKTKSNILFIDFVFFHFRYDSECDSANSPVLFFFCLLFVLKYKPSTSRKNIFYAL